MVSRRTAWRGELAWVRVSDKVKTALTEDSVALTACSEFVALDGLPAYPDRQIAEGLLLR